MNKLDHIKQLLQNNNIDTAISLLLELKLQQPENDDIHFILGNAYCKKNDWQQALNAYCQALTINPKSPARIAHDRVIEILNFYHHDRYNP